MLIAEPFPGYQDSGADIAYTLRQKGVKVIKSDPSAPVSSNEGWAFPDTEEGIYSAAQQGTTHSGLTPVASKIYVVGQPPGLVESFDDKAYLNDKLRELGGYTLPKSWLVSPENISEIINHIDRYPIVGKPVRGRDRATFE
ncbi:hypothetical protein BO79DRAFT_278227 [Aspergillus costaricaensis CBS 115574]|uniref:Uncharacterized protein n=1 Tax=Aspergillus costaricaensis CBS 115574 TaxID=1448317 RepID=A0ACD1IM50_9EURO|nr:hypothetical protein BO79DRAFT_278227 [Aspergillus costaricaensis CBS 115574]RAK91741.1 hypothetical protein BO79DRAFT_278227 [Aspergillus costaricaensis CBS 115574]